MAALIDTVQKSSGNDHTRTHILRAAAFLMRDQGYAATTLRQIGDAAGVKAGSIYYHFASKEELLLEVLRTGWTMVMEAVREQTEALPPNAGPTEKIEATIRGHLYGLLINSEFTTANTRSYNQLPEAVKSRHRVKHLAYVEHWNEILKEAMDAGAIRTDITLPVIRMFVLGALNTTVEWYNDKSGTIETFADQICALVFRGILPGTEALPSVKQRMSARRKAKS